MSQNFSRYVFLGVYKETTLAHFENSTEILTRCIIDNRLDSDGFSTSKLKASETVPVYFENKVLAQVV